MERKEWKEGRKEVRKRLEKKARNKSRQRVAEEEGKDRREEEAWGQIEERKRRREGEF